MARQQNKKPGHSQKVAKSRRKQQRWPGIGAEGGDYEKWDDTLGIDNQSTGNGENITYRELREQIKTAYGSDLKEPVSCHAEWRGSRTCRDGGHEQLISNGKRYKTAFAERDKKQTMIDLLGISTNWFKNQFCPSTWLLQGASHIQSDSDKFMQYD